MARKKRLNTAAVLGAECASALGIPKDSGSGFRTAAYVRLSVRGQRKNGRLQSAKSAGLTSVFHQ